MAEQITSLIITKISEGYWVYTVNDEDFTRDANAYTATGVEDRITIKTVTGAPQIVDVYFNVVQYIDNLDSTNNLTNPSSREELQGHLIAQGFYSGSTEGGGTGGVTTFKQLLDVAVASFAGRAGQVIKINDAETFLTAELVSFVQKFQDLSNWLGGDLQPNKYILTSSIVDEDGNSTGLIQADNDTIVNSPIPFGVQRINAKGYIESGSSEPYTYTGNAELFALEPGDFVEGINTEDGRFYELRYIGDDPTDFSNYEVIGWKKIPIPGEPTYTA